VFSAYPNEVYEEKNASFKTNCDRPDIKIMAAGDLWSAANLRSAWRILSSAVFLLMALMWTTVT